MAKGTLIAAMNMAHAAEDEFHDWYDTEHLPERQRVPGFLLCRALDRGRGSEGLARDLRPGRRWPCCRARRIWRSAATTCRRGRSA